MQGTEEGKGEGGEEREASSIVREKGGWGRGKPQLLFKIREQLYAWSRCHGNGKEKEIESL